MADTPRRFIALHESAAGFESPAAVRDWINANCKSDHKRWLIAEVIVDPVAETIDPAQIAKAREEGYIAGVEMTRKLLRLQLGLAVPGDSNG